MNRNFVLPDLGEGLADAEIVSWHVNPGDHVVTGQPLVSVETDKAVVEVPSPRSGHISKMHGEPGERIAVGEVLVEFSDGDVPDSGAIVGDVANSGSSTDAGAILPDDSGRGEPVPAAPAVRARARALGVDLGRVEGTGKGGAITLDDVERAAPAPDHGGERISGVRRTMLVNMTRAGREVVAATVTGEADIDHWPTDADITVRLALALVEGCRESPALNAWLDAARESRTLHQRVDIGIAMETGDGLFTPVLRDAGGADERELRARLDDIKDKVRSRRIAREDLLGQTISLSNFGMFAGRFASLVVIPPQVAILGAGRAEPRVVVRDDTPSVRRILPLSLSFDHRAATGVEAARFLDAVVRHLQGGTDR